MEIRQIVMLSVNNKPGYDCDLQFLLSNIQKKNVWIVYTFDKVLTVVIAFILQADIPSETSGETNDESKRISFVND